MTDTVDDLFLFGDFEAILVLLENDEPIEEQCSAVTVGPSCLVCKGFFTSAKNMTQYHKLKSKQSKAKALRKEISRSCEEQQQETET